MSLLDLNVIEDTDCLPVYDVIYLIAYRSMFAGELEQTSNYC